MRWYSTVFSETDWVDYYNRSLQSYPGVHHRVQRTVYSLPEGGGAFDLDLDPAAVSITGSAAALLAARQLEAAPGALSIIGVAAELAAGRALTADPGAVSLAGLSAGLVSTRALAAEPGAIAVAGQAAALLAGRGLAADPGAVSLAGFSAGLVSTRALAADPGAIALAGQAAALRADRRLAADPGSVSVTGVAAGLLSSGLFLATAPGSVTVAGTAVAFTLDASILGGPYLGGLALRGALCEWLSPAALRVAFSSIYGGHAHVQCYAGRTLAGVTVLPTDRQLLAAIVPSDWPQHLTLLAVAPENRLTDYGALLPPRPYNRVKISYSTAGFAADTKKIEITAGTEPGGAVDPENVLVLEEFDFAGAHTFLTDPLEGSGAWNFEVAGRDDALPDGNRGDPLAVAADIYAHPPDVALDSGGHRLAVEIEEGVLTAVFSY